MARKPRENVFRGLHCGRILLHTEFQYLLNIPNSPYRAPELLFGARSYDPFAIDLWSLGATLAEFFTPLHLLSDDSDEEYAPSEEESNNIEPFMLPAGHEAVICKQWRRGTLFDGTRGEIGLAWSIFKIRGTPTAETWPDFEQLPDARSVTFTLVPSVPLASLLPHLPNTPSSREEIDPSGLCNMENMKPTPLDLLSRFLVYPPSRRLKTVDMLLHPWFAEEMLLPSDSVPTNVTKGGITARWKGKPLRTWLRWVIDGTEDALR